MANHTSFNTSQGLYHAGFIVEDPSLSEEEQLSIEFWDDADCPEDEIILDIEMNTPDEDGDNDTKSLYRLVVPEHQRQELAKYFQLLSEILLRKRK